MKSHVPKMSATNGPPGFKQSLVVSFACVLAVLIFGSWIRGPHPEGPVAQLSGTAVTSKSSSGAVPYNIVFVSRQILKRGNLYESNFGDMPGAGAYSRYIDASPGKLQIYTASGNLVTLIDGSKPSAATLNIIDVNAPDVSYDSTQIVFAGFTPSLITKTFDTLPSVSPGSWRIYKINVNGTGLTQITFTDSVINNSQFNIPSNALYNNFSLYDDIDPIWLPDGRICFSSDRAPAHNDYAGERTSNLWVVNNNGTAMHQITSERNGAERPMVDPKTGQIVYFRWWFNGRFPTDPMTAIIDPTTAGDNPPGYISNIGLTTNRLYESYLPDILIFNSWVSAAVNPDGSGLHMFAGSQGQSSNFMAYGGSFTNSGDLITNFFPDNNMATEGGFGGINSHPRGVGNFTPIDGFANDSIPTNAPAGTQDSLLRFYSTKGFASDAAVLPDNKIVYSWAPDLNQDYGLYTITTAGKGKKLLYNAVGTSELRAKPVVSRKVPPIIPDQYTEHISLYPPLQAGPYNTNGTFTFNDLNVFANGPVDMNITSAPGIGQVNTIRFFINQQRTREASNAEFDWPIQLAELPVPPNGKIVNPNAPADQPLFEQLRSSNATGYVVPTTGNPIPSSVAQVAGMNFSRANSTFTCIGCHRGHTMIPVPTDTTDIAYTNLAPGAAIQVSNTISSFFNASITDRKVMLDTAAAYFWVTPYRDTGGQWVKLVFPVPVKIKAVVPYNIPAGGKNASSLQVNSFQVNLYSDSAGTQLAATETVNQKLAVGGTSVAFNYVVARTVQVKILNITGTYSGWVRAGLAEIEVIASGDTSNPVETLRQVAGLQETVENALFSVNLFPNPTNNQAHLNIKSEQSGTVSYTVYSLNGILVMNNKMSVAAGAATDQIIDLSGQSAGVYIINVSSGTQQRSFKLVKM
jgi:hypothetical protein